MSQSSLTTFLEKKIADNIENTWDKISKADTDENNTFTAKVSNSKSDFDSMFCVS